MSTVHENRGVKLPAIKDACVSGSIASVLSAVVLSLCSKLEEGSAAGALNGPSQWIWGEREAHTRRATARHTFLGYAIHHGMSIFWASFHEHAFGRSRGRELRRLSAPRIVAEAAGTTAVAYFVDYYVTPRRFRPGFEKHLERAAIFASYAAFAIGLALATLARKRAASRQPVSAAQSSRARSASAAASS